MTRPEGDLERRLEEALGPVPPPEALRARVLGASRRALPRRALGLVLPYAAGLLTAWALGLRAEPPPTPPPSPAPVPLESIADRPPPPAPVAPVPVPEPEETPLPRIS